MKRNPKPVWRGDWPIPKRIDLPGVRVRVKLLPGRDMEAMGASYGIWTYSPPGHNPPDAVIYLNADWPIELQRYILLHELQHATIEVLDQMLEKFPEHVMPHALIKKIEIQIKEQHETHYSDHPKPPSTTA